MRLRPMQSTTSAVVLLGGRSVVLRLTTDYGVIAVGHLV
jgi:hypothetical protein